MPEQNTVEGLLELINGNITMEPIENLLRPTRYKISGTKEEHLQNLRLGLDEGIFSFQQLAAFLDRFESFGHQHVFFFDVDPEPIQRLQDFDEVCAIVEELNTDLAVNEFDAVDLPDEPTIAAIFHDEHEFWVKWVEKREYLELVESEEDDPEYDLIRRYQKRIQRRVNVNRPGFVGDLKV